MHKKEALRQCSTPMNINLCVAFEIPKKVYLITSAKQNLGGFQKFRIGKAQWIQFARESGWEKRFG